jgi:hypothetical protein
MLAAKVATESAGSRRRSRIQKLNQEIVALAQRKISR